MTFDHLVDPASDAVPLGGGRPPHRAVVKPIPATLDVVAVVANPVRYRARYDLARAFFRHLEESGARLTIVECAFGQRPFELTDPANPRHVQVRTAHEFWAKENLINLGISRLPRNARYIAWIDADVSFARPDWVQETIQQLQHYPIVQMFAEAHDLDPDGMVMTTFRSFAWSHVHGVPRKRRSASAPAAPLALPSPQSAGRPAPPTPAPATVAVSTVGPGGVKATATTTLSFGDYYGPGMDGAGANPRIGYWHHPGFAWAARRETLDVLGGLFDVAVVGEADYMMAKAIVGEVSDMLYPGVSAGYRKAALDWQARAAKLRSNLGYVPGTILHGFHGPKALRKYWDRCAILERTKFDPSTDLARDWQGLYQLVDDGTPRAVLLRDAIRAYFRGRNEDATSS